MFLSLFGISSRFPHLQEVQNIKTENQLAHFMLKHGDNLVNTLGAEINQIEERIKVCPSPFHV